MSQAAKMQPDESVAATVRTPPAIEHQAVEWNNQTDAVYRHAFVRAPVGLVPADLHEHPTIVWKRVQANHNKSLTRFDRVLIVGDQEEWCVDAMVVDADATKVVLGNYKVIMLQQRAERFVTQDGRYMVIWSGPGYQAFRLQDDGRPPVPMSIGIYDNMEACKFKLFEAVYPKRMQ
jgi:hypothetical protein